MPRPGRIHEEFSGSLLQVRRDRERNRTHSAVRPSFQFSFRLVPSELMGPGTARILPC